jgi:hypothetical protein
MKLTRLINSFDKYISLKLGFKGFKIKFFNDRKKGGGRLEHVLLPM